MGLDALEQVGDPSLPNNRTIGFNYVKLIGKLLFNNNNNFNQYSFIHSFILFFIIPFFNKS